MNLRLEWKEEKEHSLINTEGTKVFVCTAIFWNILIINAQNVETVFNKIESVIKVDEERREIQKFKIGWICRQPPGSTKQDGHQGSRIPRWDCYPS